MFAFISLHAEIKVQVDLNEPREYLVDVTTSFELPLTDGTLPRGSGPLLAKEASHF